MNRSIGLFGGSFNPIHCGHIALARHLLQATGLDEVWFVVSPMNPFKTQATDLLADDLRLHMVRMALADQPQMQACDVEFHLPRPSYMWNTLQHLVRQYPDSRFTLLIGADNWLSFERWAHWQEIMAHHAIVVYPREGCPVSLHSLPTGVTLVPAPLFPVSSTMIRQRVAAGLPVTGMVPPAIESAVLRYYGAEAAE